MAKKKKATAKNFKAKDIKAASKPNLFESIYNKKKFDILGQKSRTAVKKRGQARKEGIDKRKGTLLVEYKQRQKANTFQDRRFGENDEGLSAEDKALARFQKQKLKELEGRKLGLDDGSGGEGEELTHLGAPLKDFERFNDFASDGEDEYAVDPETEASLHFGGGFQKKAEGSEEDFEPRRKSKKEVMEEIMAKSKAFKAEKARQKEEDLDAADQLDQELAEIMQSGGLSSFIKAKGQKDKASSALTTEDVAYDVARREMVFDSKAKVSERTKTAEELAQEEVQRLENLEKERQRRMAGEEEDEPADQEPQGGYAKKRAKRKREENEAAKEATGDALEDDFELGSDSGSGEEESDEDDVPRAKQKMSLDERRQMRAAGDHPLQESFRGAAGQLLTKYGLLASDSEDEDDDENEEEDGNESDEEEESKGSDTDGVENEGDGEEDAEIDSTTNDPRVTGTSRESKAETGNSGSHSEEGADGTSEEGSESGKDGDEANVLEQINVAEHRNGADQAADLPFTIPPPEDYQTFAQLANKRSAADLQVIIHRIRVSSNIALAEENKRKTQVFYGVLVQHFAILASQSPLPMSHLDVLTVNILEMTPTVPLFAASTALARLQRLQERLHSKLQGGENAWPSQAQMLLLRLWATIFPASDKRHSVLTPAMLLIASHLSLCPVDTLQDIKSGLFLAALATQMAASASRWMPEPLNFIAATLRLLCRDTIGESDQAKIAPQSGKSGHRSDSPAPPSHMPVFQFAADLPQQPRLRRKQQVASESPVSLRVSSGGDADQPEQLSVSCAVAAVQLLERFASQNGSLPSLPEALVPAISALKELKGGQLPKVVKLSIEKALDSVSEQSEALQAERQPLKKIKLQKEIKQYNPRYEEDFVSGKDYDPDSERAERRKLKKLVSNERRGAIRELRKDASYLGEQREKERQGEAKERKRDVRGNTAWLAKLEQDFRSGGQGGMWKKKRNK